jgi:hypothetical protein
MKPMNIMRRPRRYAPGTRVVQFSTNRPGEVVQILPGRRRLVATTGPDRNQDRRLAYVVHTRDLRREADYA